MYKRKGRREGERKMVIPGEVRDSFNGQYRWRKKVYLAGDYLSCFTGSSFIDAKVCKMTVQVHEEYR